MPVFSGIRTEYGEILCISLYSPNAGRYGARKTLITDTFDAVWLTRKFFKIWRLLPLQLSTYGIYSSERQGRSFNFEFFQRGAYSRDALFRGRHTLNISKRHKSTFNLSLKSNNKNRNNNRRIESLMFKIVCKTPPFTKEK